MSQMTSLLVAPKASEKVRVPVPTHAVMERKAHAPTGRGLRTRPSTVVMNIERRDQPCMRDEEGGSTRLPQDVTNSWNSVPSLRQELLSC